VARRVFVFDQPDRFVAVAIGVPGDRAFFLQAGQGRAVVTLGIEKVQVAALAQRIDELLEAVEAAPANITSNDDGLLSEAVEPMVELFRVGTMALGWNGQDETLVVEARAATDEDEEEDDDQDAEPEATADARDGAPAALRVRLTASQAQQFALAAAAVVVAGRPACPFCGEPLDPSGHFCPRTIGQLN
jgi:uncharacterized repeat protein (TIGR03847 family)